MQRPCERENRASVSCRDALKYCPYYFQSKGSNVSFARLPDLQKKKRKNSIVPSRNQSPGRNFRRDRIEHIEAGAREISVGCRACICMSKGCKSPCPGGFERVCWLYARDLRVYVYEVTLPAFFQTSRVSPSVRSPPSIFPFVGLRRRAEERRGFSSEGAVSLTGRPRGGFAIRGATRSFAVLSRKRSEAAFKARSNNWSGRKGTIVLERSFERKFEFRFERIVSLSRRDPYLNADFARFSTVVSLLFARERVNDESGSFFALGEIFFDEPGYFLRFSTLCRSMMILPLKFKWTKSTWDERGERGGGEKDRIIPPIDPLPSLGFLLGWKTEERDGRNSCGISVLFPRFTSPLSRSLRNTREAISREGEGGGEGITTVSEVSSGLAVRRIGGKAIGGILDRGEARILDEITWPLCPSAP